MIILLAMPTLACLETDLQMNMNEQTLYDTCIQEKTLGSMKTVRPVNIGLKHKELFKK